MEIQLVVTVIIGAALLVWCLWQRMSLTDTDERITGIAHRVKELEDRHKVDIDAAYRRTKALQLENTRLRVALGEARTDEDVFPAKQNMRVSFTKRGGTEYDGGNES